MAGRNIVILSDGTGNSAAKITKTNVWRIYQALDLKSGDQLAIYDDGVGTGGFQFLRALGGAFGFGMARNVRQLYEELCRHYDGDKSGSGDNIFLIGFSRGAYTARVLSGVIRNCGIINRDPAEGLNIPVWRWSKFGWEDVPVASDQGLKVAARVAYRSMRKRYDNAFVTNAYRWIRDRVFRLGTPNSVDFRRTYAVSRSPRIKFLGVFDTVSAYGLPIDEMAIAIHKHVVPLRFPDNILSKRVEHAYQALALDEGRHTFHPVLWTEREFRTDWEDAPADDRPKQAWFAGMHSDVGGGYADDRLSLVPALWMMEQAMNKAGLRFRPSAVQDLRARANHIGDMHDSRRGLAAFYRYKPRILKRLGQEDLDGNRRPEVQIDRFKIHHSVFDRIIATDADYAPPGIPQDYDVVMSPTRSDSLNVVSADQAGYETAKEREDRATLQNAIEDTIVRRRAVYFLMLGLALALIALPLLWLPNPAYIPEGWQATFVSILLWPVTYLPIPGPERISQFWSEHPYWFFGLAAGFVGAWLSAAALKRSMQTKSQIAWGHLVGRPVLNPVARWQWVDGWRKIWGGAHRVWTKKVLPVILVLLLFVGVPAVVGWRYFMFKDFDWGSVCVAQQQTASGDPIQFSTKFTCLDTGRRLNNGDIYEITIRLTEDWKDKTLKADPTGLDWSSMSLGEKAFMVSMSLTRRFWSEDWFAMMGSIGRSRDYAFRIDAKPFEGNNGSFTYRFKAWRGGTLYLFVNDALVPGYDFYKNNEGTAEITIEKVGEL